MAMAYFSTTPAARLRDFFPAKETPHIRKTPPAWAHHGFTYEEMLAVVPGHREPRNVSDYLAFQLVKLARYVCRVKSRRDERLTCGILRWFTDIATGVKPEQKVDPKNSTTAVVADKPLTEAQWVSTATELHFCDACQTLIG